MCHFSWLLIFLLSIYLGVHTGTFPCNIDILVPAVPRQDLFLTAIYWSSVSSALMQHCTSPPAGPSPLQHSLACPHTCHAGPPVPTQGQGHGAVLGVPPAPPLLTSMTHLPMVHATPACHTPMPGWPGYIFLHATPPPMHQFAMFDTSVHPADTWCPHSQCWHILGPS